MKRLIIAVVLLFAGQAWAGEYDGFLSAYHQCLINCNDIKDTSKRAECVGKCVDLLPTAPLDRSGVTDPPYGKNDPVERRIVITESENRERLIREWAASGEICRVLDHKWEKSSGLGYGEFRYCPVCRLHQSREWGEWK